MTNRDSIKSKIFEEEREGFGEGEGKLSRESFPSPSKFPNAFLSDPTGTRPATGRNGAS